MHQLLVGSMEVSTQNVTLRAAWSAEPLGYFEDTQVPFHFVHNELIELPV